MYKFQLFFNTYNKEQWACISHQEQEEHGKSTLWLDLRQYRKWYTSQREIAEQSAGQNQRGLEHTREEWMAVKIMFQEKQYELTTTLQSIHSEIEIGEHYHFVEEGKVQRTKRLEQFLRYGRDKMAINYDARSYINLLNGIQEGIKMEVEYNKRTVKVSYEEEDWLKININLLNTIVRQIRVVLPLLMMLSANLDHISDQNREGGV